MIVDTLDNLNKYKEEVKNLDVVIDFLNNHDLEKLSYGRYDILGDEVYLSLQDYVTKMKDYAHPELHRKYIDVQIVVEGNERIGYTDISETTPFTPYDDEKDIEFVNGKVQFMGASPNKFFVFFPQDAHMPSIAVTEPKQVKKAVFKIKI